jgi:hypothetical protein
VIALGRLLRDAINADLVSIVLSRFVSRLELFLCARFSFSRFALVFTDVVLGNFSPTLQYPVTGDVNLVSFEI